MLNQKEIIDDFIVQTKVGLFCSYGNFYLDPKEPFTDAVISHAHGDHAVGGNQNVYCTEATSIFMKHRYKKFAAGDFFIKSYKETFNLNGVEISFYPAGHILGSAKKLNEVKPNIMLGSYALGKSQRLISMINQHCPQKRILIHHSIVPFVKIYEQLGINLGKYEVYDRKVMKHNQTDMIYIVPPMVYHSYIKAINVVRIFATGWKHLQNNNEVQLYISDHVDWKAILKTIEEVAPQEVWTTHGSGTQLKSHFAPNLVVKLLN
ncbi:MAG: exonuclease [Pedobacter sp.]|nr:MAG: exonuclease [Pedobacter sp.]